MPTAFSRRRGETPRKRFEALTEINAERRAAFLERKKRAAERAAAAASWNQWRSNRYNNAGKVGQALYGYGAAGLSGLGTAAGTLGRGAAGAAGLLGRGAAGAAGTLGAYGLAAARGTRNLAGRAGNISRLGLKRGLFGKRTLTEDQEKLKKADESLNSPAFLKRVKRARTLQLIDDKHSQLGKPLPMQGKEEDAAIQWGDLTADQHKEIEDKVTEELQRKGGARELVRKFPGMLQYLGNKSLTVLYYAGLIPVALLTGLGLGAKALVGAAGRGLGAIGTRLGSLAQGVKNTLGSLKAPNLRSMKHQAARYLRGNSYLESLKKNGKAVPAGYYRGLRASLRNLVMGKIGRTESARIRSATTRAKRDIFCKENEKFCDEYGKVLDNKEAKAAYEAFMALANLPDATSESPSNNLEKIAKSPNKVASETKKSSGFFSGTKRLFGKAGSYLGSLFTRKSSANTVAPAADKSNSPIKPGLMARTRKALGNAANAVGSGFKTAAGKVVNAFKALGEGVSAVSPAYQKLQQQRIDNAVKKLESAANSGNPAEQEKALQGAEGVLAKIKGG